MKTKLKRVKRIIAYNHVLLPPLFFYCSSLSSIGVFVHACLILVVPSFPTPLRLSPPLTQLVGASFPFTVRPQPADYYQKSYRH